MTFIRSAATIVGVKGDYWDYIIITAREFLTDKTEPSRVTPGVSYLVYEWVKLALNENNPVLF